MATDDASEGAIRALLRRLPRVDRVVAHPSLDGARRRLGAEVVTRLARLALQQGREQVRSGGPLADLPTVVARVAELADGALARRARRVINATGVVLHTNLGRAPLGAVVARAVGESAARYLALELDLPTGRRGPRGAFAEMALRELSGAEAALVVNNNAAAVLLALTTLAAGREVVVSRGEQIEIGGGFRIPEVLARSGARMIEVGTTNRTRLSDYERALASHRDVAVLLRVHPGNFRQSGFVERPTLAALVGLAHRHGRSLIEDLGGGALVDLTRYGLSGEPTVQSSIGAGADVVCFSCDKLLGGPQAGALVGKAEPIERIRRDPLARALRLGRLSMVALEETLALYLRGELDAIPALRALRMPLGEVRTRVEGWCRALATRGVCARPLDVAAAAGGGALAETPLASVAAAIETAEPDALAARLRAAAVPVLGRVAGTEVLLDGRTVLADEDDALLDAVAAAMAAAAGA